MNSKISIAQGTEEHLASIDYLRHAVYASELGQFESSPEKAIHDRPGVESVYIVAHEHNELVGFVGITPPTSPAYSFEHYIQRKKSGLPFNNGLFEIRALTVVNEARGTHVAPALMYAAFRWVQENGGTHLAAIGHRKVRDMYLRLGMCPQQEEFQCGNLHYELLSAPVSKIGKELTRFESRLKRMEKQVDWKLGIPFRATVECYHGGAFFDAVGPVFDDLAHRNEIINADVLDAWFPPCPEARQTLHEHLGWLMRTSPPNHAEGLVQTIAQVRNLKAENILPGGGSSPLIFLAFRHWLTADSRALILNPTYGEYAHVLEKVIGCSVERFNLLREDGYKVNTDKLAAKLQEGFDLVVWVNPNSPTGRHVPRSDIENVLRQSPASSRVWIDETYIEYAQPGQSLEGFAAEHSQVVVVKSMSKVYGLSGLRAGYLCATPNTLAPLRGLMPPWSVSLPAQVAAVKALQHPAYYKERYSETRKLRTELVRGLRQIGITEIIPGIANFILFHLPEFAPNGDGLIQRCREKGLFLRDASEMGAGMGDRAIRTAVKDAETNQRILSIMEQSLTSAPHEAICHD
ncbi:histidinol-phosphate aminotransferase family protein [Pontiellaceae bacterium B12227]|nr:histidinol-phosphate aminotransferase family protein [Pontiellaceae bacterium B12227]